MAGSRNKIALPNLNLVIYRSTEPVSVPLTCMLHDDLTLEEIHEEAAEECREVCAVVSLIEAMRKGSGYTEKRCVQSAIGLYWSTSESSQGVRELAEGIGHIFFELGQQYERKRVMTERSREISA